MTTTSKAAPRRIVITLDCYDAIDTVEAPGLSPQIVTGALREYLARVAPHETLTEFRLRRLAALRADVKQQGRRDLVFCEGCQRRIRDDEGEDYRFDPDDGIAVCLRCEPGDGEPPEDDDEPTLAMLRSEDVEAAARAVAGLVHGPFVGEFGDGFTITQTSGDPESRSTAYDVTIHPGLSANDTTDHPGNDPAF